MLKRENKTESYSVTLTKVGRNLLIESLKLKQHLKFLKALEIGLRATWIAFRPSSRSALIKRRLDTMMRIMQSRLKYFERQRKLATPKRIESGDCVRNRGKLPLNKLTRYSYRDLSQRQTSLSPSSILKMTFFYDDPLKPEK